MVATSQYVLDFCLKHKNLSYHEGLDECRAESFNEGYNLGFKQSAFDFYKEISGMIEHNPKLSTLTSEQKAELNDNILECYQAIIERLEIWN